MTARLARGSLGIALLLAGVLAGGTVGLMVGASTVPQIHACIGKGGVMSYSSTGKCATGQKALAWNIQGLTGARGPTGLQGPAPSVSTSYYLLAGTGPIPVKQKVPPGDYLVEVTGASDDVPGVTCEVLEPGANVVIRVQGPLVDLRIPVHVDPVPQGDISFFCDANGQVVSSSVVMTIWVATRLT